jgi:hypothetical protein
VKGAQPATDTAICIQLRFALDHADGPDVGWADLGALVAENAFLSEAGLQVQDGFADGADGLIWTKSQGAGRTGFDAVHGGAPAAGIYLRNEDGGALGLAGRRPQLFYRFGWTGRKGDAQGVAAAGRQGGAGLVDVFLLRYVVADAEHGLVAIQISSMAGPP